MKWLVILGIAAALGVGYAVQHNEGGLGELFAREKPEPAAEILPPAPPRPTAQEILSQHSLDAGDRVGSGRSSGSPVVGGIRGHLQHKIGGAMKASERRASGR